MVYLSRDHGSTWQVVLYDLEIGNLHFHTSYMTPEYNGKESLLHWLSDIRINPFDPDEVWFNSGTDVYKRQTYCSGSRKTERMKIHFI